MAQKPQVIDITRSYVPGDPNAFPQNLVSTQREDLEEETPPIVIYEGHNFIPTAYGYRSYFGDNSKLDISTLASRCDELFIYQLGNLKNIIIALCEDGIHYTASTTLAGALWTRGITLTVPPAGTYKEWTYTVIENILYIYRQGEPHYWKITPTGFTIVPSPLGISLTITPVVPTFLNMAGQLGIFRANASLAFWDSANSIGWSSPLNLQDFVPSITTLAGNAIFSGILGSIVTVRSQGDGFIIYTTKGIVGVRYIPGSVNLWEATTITDTAGINSAKEVANGMTENEHFAYTSTGIKKIGSYNALNKMHAFENILPEVYDILRENNNHIYLKFMNGRFLFFSLLNTDYINGKVTFISNNLDSYDLILKLGDYMYKDGDELPVDVDGVSFGTAVSEDVGKGFTSGMYISWSGSGVGSYLGVTTPMHYYQMDKSGARIPSRIYSGPLFKSDGYTADNAPINDFVAKAQPDYPVDYSQLGYTKGNPGQMGRANAKLSSYISAQYDEWTNLSKIQAANAAEIQKIPPGETITVKGFTEIAGPSNYGLLDAVKAFAASVPEASIAGNSVTYTVETAGDFISGAGTVIGPTFSGAGTNYGFCTMTKNFVGGFTVKKRATRVFSARTGNVLRTTWAAGVDRIVENGTWVLKTFYGFTGPEVQAKKEVVTLNPPSTVDISMAGRTPGYKTGTNVTPWGDGFQRYTSYSYYNTNGTSYGSYSMYWEYLWGGEGNPGVGWTKSQSYGHYIDYTEYKFISVVENTTITSSATFNAYQSNLTWELAEPGEVPNYNTRVGNLNLQYDYPNVNFNMTYPGSTFLLQDGSLAPIYPTYTGALVLDTALKKWGKMKADYKALLDYNSFNSANQNLTVFSNLGVDMAILKADGYVYNMDSKPLDSYIKYGKLGYFRQGFTRIYEIKVFFRLPFSGSITIDTSINGISVEELLRSITTFSGVIKTNLFPDISGRWHTIKIEGNYDLQYLEIRGNISGRR